MSFAVQASLWSGGSAPDNVSSANASFNDLRRTERKHLGAGAWVELHRGWMRDGFDLLEEILTLTDWRAERRHMYDNVVDVPRLLRFYRSGETVPWPVLVEARTLLSANYLTDLGEDLTSTGMCLYRSGHDSVAWHGDTIGRGATQDTVVAILSLGACRTFAMRPRGGGGSIRFAVDHGDLIVMGGSCQRTWDHAVPKTTRHVGPRVSIQFRAAGVS